MNFTFEELSRVVAAFNVDFFGGYKHPNFIARKIIFVVSVTTSGGHLPSNTNTC